MSPLGGEGIGVNVPCGSRVWDLIREDATLGIQAAFERGRAASSPAAEDLSVWPRLLQVPLSPASAVLLTLSC